MKGKPEVNSIDVEVTRHGPIVNGLHSGRKPQARVEVDHLRSASYRAFPFFEVDSANNWQEFRSGVFASSARRG